MPPPTTRQSIVEEEEEEEEADSSEEEDWRQLGRRLGEVAAAVAAVRRLPTVLGRTWWRRGEMRGGETERCSDGDDDDDDDDDRDGGAKAAAVDNAMPASRRCLEERGWGAMVVPV
mmetsp:Transcript_10409/g.20785  ORF Transcript_10409/g.20785 Transcript_10409/m.20785 type:complete len:116 (-) Transcript_10409:171-518(-)